MTQMDDELHQEIEELEARIAALTEAAERCRKVVAASRMAATVAGLTLAAMALGVVRLDPLALIAALTGAIAGIALSGSSRSTLDELRGTVRELDARRAALIDGLSLRIVESS
jgi:hypothetical protein